jgi:hypothetical protein
MEVPPSEQAIPKLESGRVFDIHGKRQEEDRKT